MRDKERPSALTAPALVILLGLSVAYFTYSTTSRVEDSQKQRDFDARAAGYVERLEDCLRVQTDLLRFVAVLGARDGIVTGGDLERFLSSALLTDTRFGALRAVAWVPHVPKGGLQDWLTGRRTRADGADFELSAPESGTLDALASHDIVDAVFPKPRYPLARGVDLASDPALRATLQEPVRPGDLRTSDAVETFAEEPPEGRVGLMVLVPALADVRGAPAGTGGGPLIGHVAGLFSLRELLEQAVELHGDEEGPRVNLAITSDEGILAEVGPPPVPGGLAYTRPPENLWHLWSIDVKVAQPQALTVDELLARPSSLLTASVCIMMLLFAWIAWTLNSQKWMVQQRVAHQTSELRQQNVALEGKERELNEANRRLLEMSNTDPLTGILNRRAFEVQLDKERDRSLRTGVPFGLLIFDVDKFKDYNDRYGHAAGDEVLRRVAGIINTEARRIDTVARYGGEEFVVLATGTDAAGLLALGERIRGRIQEAAIQDLTAPRGVLTVSGGGSLSNAALGHDPKTAFEIADRCLYEAKSTGRNRVIMVM
jgi:diguanylate cyclase (GGDEF)-like protein